MERKFKCKDEVVVRLKESGSIWFYGVVSHSDDASVVLSGGFRHPYERYDVLPFNGNEHLVGTTDEPEEEIVLKEGEFILCHDYIELIQDGVGTLSRYVDLTVDNIKSRAGTFRYCIPMSKYNQNNLEETRKWILKVNGDKLIKVHLK